VTPSPASVLYASVPLDVFLPFFWALRKIRRAIINADRR